MKLIVLKTRVGSRTQSTFCSNIHARFFVRDLSARANVELCLHATVLRPAGDVITQGDRSFLAVRNGAHA